MSAKVRNIVANAEAEWNRRYLAGDVTGFSALLDEAFVYVSERGRFGKAEYVANLGSGVIEMSELVTERSTIRLFDSIAIVDGEVRMSARFKGEDISGTDSYTRVWRIQADTAHALSQHANAKPRQ